MAESDPEDTRYLAELDKNVHNALPNEKDGPTASSATKKRRYAAAPSEKETAREPAEPTEKEAPGDVEEENGEDEKAEKELFGEAGPEPEPEEQPEPEPAPAPRAARKNEQAGFQQWMQRDRQQKLGTTTALRVALMEAKMQHLLGRVKTLKRLSIVVIVLLLMWFAFVYHLIMMSQFQSLPLYPRSI